MDWMVPAFVMAGLAVASAAAYWLLERKGVDEPELFIACGLFGILFVGALTTAVYCVVQNDWQTFAGAWLLAGLGVGGAFYFFTRIPRRN